MDVDLDRVVADLFAPFAQALHQLVFADQAAHALQQHFEQTEFTRREFDHAAVDGGHAPSLVVDQGPVFDGGGGAAHAAARECTNPSFEFLQAEGLGHVVVRAVVQALDAFFHAVSRSQDQHRHAAAPGPQAFQDFEAVHFRQTQIQDDQVEFIRGHERGIGLAAIGHMIDSGTRGAQCAQQTIGQHLVIFGDQYAHARSPQRTALRFHSRCSACACGMSARLLRVNDSHWHRPPDPG